MFALRNVDKLQCHHKRHTTDLDSVVLVRLQAMVNQSLNLLRYIAIWVIRYCSMIQIFEVVGTHVGDAVFQE